MNQQPSSNQVKIFSPFRTKQPSINNSRRISKEREISKNSHNSIHSPKFHKSVKGGEKQEISGKNTMTSWQ
jgi:hypothetical protein